VFPHYGCAYVTSADTEIRRDGASEPQRVLLSSHSDYPPPVPCEREYFDCELDGVAHYNEQRLWEPGHDLIGNTFENGPIGGTEIPPRLPGGRGRNSGGYNDDVGFYVCNVGHHLDPHSLVVKRIH
jgi:hypothetical protein